MPTVQKHARLNKGDKVLNIVDILLDKDPHKRKVRKTITIGG